MKIINEYILDDFFYNNCFCILEKSKGLVLCKKENKNEYYLILLDNGEQTIINLPKSKLYLGKGDQKGDYWNSVFFIMEKGFGVVVDEKTLYYYKNIKNQPEYIQINNSELMNNDIRARMEVCFSNSNVILITARQYQRPDTQYGLVLNIDLENKTAAWKDILTFKNEDFVSEFRSKELTIINDLIVYDNKKFAYVVGEGNCITSITKYGMTYYALIEIDDEGKILSSKISSGNLHKKYQDEKRRGILGKFTASRDFVILTPIVKNNEWKGRQKLFNMKTETLLDIKLPRGYSKYTVVDYKDNCFFIWNYKEGKKFIAQCIES